MSETGLWIVRQTRILIYQKVFTQEDWTMNQNYYFHYTKEEHLESILKNGLVPTVGETYEKCAHEIYEPRVFLTRNPDMCYHAADEICLTWRETWSHSKTIILVINMEGLTEDLEQDDGFYALGPKSTAEIVKTPHTIHRRRIVDWRKLFRKVECCGQVVYDYDPDTDSDASVATRYVGRRVKLVCAAKKFIRKEVTHDGGLEDMPEDLLFTAPSGNTLVLHSFVAEVQCPVCGKKIETLNVD